jgi:hypothetical protein
MERSLTLHHRLATGPCCLVSTAQQSCLTPNSRIQLAALLPLGPGLALFMTHGMAVYLSISWTVPATAQNQPDQSALNLVVQYKVAVRDQCYTL